jgi:hypothetical protein
LTFLGAACSSTPAVIPTKNLEHPSDMTFVCVAEVKASDGTTLLSGQPMEACHTRDTLDPNVFVGGLRTIGTFAFIANPGRNELAIADMDIGRLLDLTPASAGYGMLPIGANPEAIASTQDGCWVVTANRNSCDFTMLDPSRLLAPTFSSSASAAVPATAFGLANAPASRRVVVQTGSSHSVLYSSTGEIAFLPSVWSSADQQDCRANPKPRAVATFPGCDMVALLDFSFGTPTDPTATATIVSAYYVRPDLPGGFLAAVDEPVCPADCVALSDTPALDGGAEVVDGGADGGGGSPIDSGASGSGLAWYLQPLALVPDGTRVYVGSLLDTAITSLDISATSLSSPVRISLAENPIGVNRLRLGIDPYRAEKVTRDDGSTFYVQNQFLEDRGRFLYAITRDDSIRVVDVDVGLAMPIECDANILAPADQKATGCFPVGSGPRRPLAQGPGIRIPIPNSSSPDNPPPMPRDVAFAELLPPIAADSNLQSLTGQFGFVVASDGQVYVINLAPNNEPQTATHSFRESRDVGQAVKTPVAISIAPQRTVVVSDQAFPSTPSYSALDGPRIMSFSPDNGLTTSWMDFPDLDTAGPSKWDVIWEGALPRATRSSGIVQPATDGVSAGVLSDPGADFCVSDAHPGDVLMFAGCTQNSDCQPDDEFTCRVAVSGARGICVPIAAGSSADLLVRCGRYMGSRMRYEIAQASPTSLALRLKLDEVPKTSLNPCTKETEETVCRPDLDHGKGAGGSPDGGQSHGFECVQVYDPAKEPPRCVKRCSADTDCRAGNVCESLPGALPGAGTKFCVEAPPIQPSCFPQPTQNYSVRAGHSFMVYGSTMPSLSTMRVSSDGTTCQPQPAADPSLVARIPLAAPRCPTDATFLGQAKATVTDGKTVPAPFFVQQLTAQAGSNPCLYQGSYNDGEDPSSVEAGAPDDPVKVFFQNPQIRFVMTNLNQYAGDLLAVHFELQYGFIPLFVTPNYEVQLTMGTRVVVGPTKTPESPIKHNTGAISYPYIYVVDQGRTALTPGSHGQVLRINPRAGSNESASFDTTLSGSTPFQIQ